MSKTRSVSTMWVYSLTDYRQLFDLHDEDLTKSILDFPGGISSFNAQMKKLGHFVVSADEIYDQDANEIKALAENIYVHAKEHLETNLELLKSPNEAVLQSIEKTWSQSQGAFLKDYTAGQSEGRYVFASLPKLPFKDQQFQLMLCSDLLFHEQARSGMDPNAVVSELCRVAEEVRIFPLLDETGQTSELLGPLMLELQQQDYGLEVREVPYEQHQGGNAMLRIWSTHCVVENE